MGERHHRIVLYETYQSLLTEKQQDIFRAYYYEDLSLAEIAEHTRTSRQAVHDVLQRTEDLLKNYESMLGLSALEDAYDALADQVDESLRTDVWPKKSYRALLKMHQERKDSHGL